MDTLHTRRDELGRGIGILPANCRKGHDLAKVGWRCTHDNYRVITLTCQECHVAWELKPEAHIYEVELGSEGELLARHDMVRRSAPPEWA